MARINQARAIYVGPEEPANRPFFDEVVLGKAGEVLPELVKDLVSKLVEDLSQPGLFVQWRWCPTMLYAANAAT